MPNENQQQDIEQDQVNNQQDGDQIDTDNSNLQQDGEQDQINDQQDSEQCDQNDAGSCSTK